MESLLLLSLLSVPSTFILVLALILCIKSKKRERQIDESDETTGKYEEIRYSMFPATPNTYSTFSVVDIAEPDTTYAMHHPVADCGPAQTGATAATPAIAIYDVPRKHCVAKDDAVLYDVPRSNKRKASIPDYENVNAFVEAHRYDEHLYANVNQSHGQDDLYERVAPVASGLTTHSQSKQSLVHMNNSGSSNSEDYDHLHWLYWWDGPLYVALVHSH